MNISLSTIKKEVEINKLPIGKYAQLLKAFKELPKTISGLDKIDNDTIIAELPNIIEKSLPEFLAMLAIATPLRAEELALLALDEIIDLTLAVIEVNKYKEIYDKIKKAIARPATPAVATPK